MGEAVSKSPIQSIADTVDSWADVASGFVFGVVAMALVNVVVSLCWRSA